MEREKTAVKVTGEKVGVLSRVIPHLLLSVSATRISLSLWPVWPRFVPCMYASFGENRKGKEGGVGERKQMKKGKKICMDPKYQELEGRTGAFFLVAFLPSSR